jgi:uncharacterized membrane protein (DUF4010 family)
MEHLKKSHQEIINLANTLSNDDLCALINAVSSRLEVYLGSIGLVCISTEVEYAHMNGMTVQVNTTMAQLEDIREDDQIQHAMKMYELRNPEKEVAR